MAHCKESKGGGMTMFVIRANVVGLVCISLIPNLSTSEGLKIILEGIVKSTLWAFVLSRAITICEATSQAR